MFIKTVLLGGENLTPQQEKMRKLFMYLVSGGITTVVNWVCYAAFDKLVLLQNLGIEPNEFNNGVKTLINQIVCWVIAVLVAFFLNKIFVFRSKGNLIRELASFTVARIMSFLVLELGLYMLMLWGCAVITGKETTAVMFMIATFTFTYEYLVKIINSIFIVIANYVMSKLMVFKKKDMVDYNKETKEGEDNA